MKVIEAINETDALKPNMYDQTMKIRWLSRLEQRIYDDVICTHEYNDGETEIEFSGYTDEDLETEMIVPEPYDEMYTHWLSAQIDRNNMEYDSFNNSNALFESVFSAYRNHYNSEHMPVTTTKVYF